MSTSIWKPSRSSVWSYCQRMVTHFDRDPYVSYCGGLFANFMRHEKQLKLQKIYVVCSLKPDTENMFVHIFIGTIKRDKCPQNSECFIVIEKRIILLAKKKSTHELQEQRNAGYSGVHLVCRLLNWFNSTNWLCYDDDEKKKLAECMILWHIYENQSEHMPK